MSEYREYVIGAIDGVLPLPAKKPKPRHKRLDLVLKREPAPGIGEMTPPI